MSSTKSSVAYHERMANNGMDIDVDVSPTLFYEEEQEKALWVSKVVEHPTNMRLQGDSLIVPELTPQHVIPQWGPIMYNEDNNVINI